MRTLLISLLLGCAPLAAAIAAGDADEMPLYEGLWRARLDDQGAARITLRGWQGTWRWTGPGNAACRGKALPITIQHSTASGLEFTAWGTTVSPACPDIGISLEPVDARTLEGTTSSGRKVRMTRSPRG